MNLIKRHKNLAIIGMLTLILLIIMFIIFARMIFSTGETEYGQRLKGLEKLDKSVTKEIIKDPIEYFYSNWYRPCIIQLPDTEEFCHLLIDGIDTVSLKEFIRKNYPEATIDMHIWSKHGSSVKYMATYEDENILVKTVRPYRDIIPLKKKNNN